MTAEATSSWHAPDDTPSVEPRPGLAPRKAALPPGVIHAIPIGAGGEPQPAFVVTPPPPPVVPPTEQERRQDIVAAGLALVTADTVAERAQAALARAEQHIEACRVEVEAFSDIDARLRELHVAALRDSGSDRPQIVVPDELRDRLTARDAARIAATAAQAALPTFQREHEVARDEASTKRIAVSRAVDSLIGDYALDMLQRRQRLAKELEGLDADLLSFEQHSAPRVLWAIGNYARGLYSAGRAVVPLDTGQWRQLHQRLREDPESALELRPPATTVQKAA